MEINNVIEIKHISKSFPGIKANDDISLTLRKGEIHALLGENGAGKSTLMSILFGLYEPDEGEILVNGKLAKIKSPVDATHLGIGMVHQHFKLVEIYSALENIVLGYEPTKYGFLSYKETRKKLEEYCKKYNFNIDLDQKIEDMPVGAQQKVEILKMLSRNNDVLIFDEPTAVLTPQEIEELMESMKELVKEGKSILFISHKLNEIMEVSDRISILRKGKLIGTYDTKDCDKEMLSKLMVGRDVELNVNKSLKETGKTVLSVNNLTVYNKAKKKDVVHNVSFDVKEGEIVCIAGIEGNGQSELIYAITGLNKAKEGEIILHDVDRFYYENLKKDKINSISKKGYKNFIVILDKINNYLKEGLNYIKYAFLRCFDYIKYGILFIFNKKKAKLNKRLTPKEYKNRPRYVDVHLEDLSIRERNKSGVSHVPEDRHKHGLILDMSLKDNIVMQRYFEPEFQKFGFINNKSREEYAKRIIDSYDVRSGQGIQTIVRSMSGGNQQKAILGREIDRNSSLLIACQPTRGLDVGAIESIHKKLIENRDNNKAVLLVSFELDEVMNLADRILVMFNGEITASLDPKKTDVKEIGLYMSGAKRMNFGGNENE